MIPGVKNPAPHTREEAKAFYASEGNCNMCGHLKRTKHPKDPHGFLQGQCLAAGAFLAIKFHPDDPMHMKCWEAR